MSHCALQVKLGKHSSMQFKMGFDLSFFSTASNRSALLELLTFCASYLIAKQVPRKKNVKFIDTIFFTIHFSGKFILQNLKYIYIYI